MLSSEYLRREGIEAKLDAKKEEEYAEIMRKNIL